MSAGQGEAGVQDGVEVFCDGNVELARVVRRDFRPPSTVFVTPDHFRQQLGFIVYSSGQKIKRHRHNPVERKIVGTPEVVLVRSGRCVVGLYAENETFVTDVELGEGDVIVFSAGGHGFHMLEDAILMEVKQGPFVTEKDKVHF